MTKDHNCISNFENDSVISGTYIIQDVQRCMTRGGSNYLRATLKDSSGSIGMVFWEYDGDITPANNGYIVEVIGMVGTYRDALQVCAEAVELADLSDWSAEDLSVLVPTAPIDVNAYCTYVSDLVSSLSIPDLRNICNDLFSLYWDRFCEIPAGKSVHHAFLHGLLMHTVDMAMVAETVAANNSDTVNRDLLIAGVLLHDIGKVLEFNTSPVTNLVSGYSEQGNLMGHSILGAMEIAWASARVDADAELSLLLQHMVLSHHGDPDAGAAKVPMTIEAEILHDLDMLDSRKQICAESLMRSKPQEYSAYIPTLERRMFHHGFSVPDAAHNEAETEFDDPYEGIVFLEEDDFYGDDCAYSEYWEPDYDCVLEMPSDEVFYRDDPYTANY